MMAGRDEASVFEEMIPFCFFMLFCVGEMEEDFIGWILVRVLC
jgi:hypothetical protein